MPWFEVNMKLNRADNRARWNPSFAGFDCDISRHEPKAPEESACHDLVGIQGFLGFDTHTRTRTRSQAHRRTRAHARTHAHTHTRTHAHTHTRTHAHTHTRTHAHTHTRTHAHTHTRTHAHTHTRTGGLACLGLVLGGVGCSAVFFGLFGGCGCGFAVACRASVRGWCEFGGWVGLSQFQGSRLAFLRPRVFLPHTWFFPGLVWC